MITAHYMTFLDNAVSGKTKALAILDSEVHVLYKHLKAGTQSW